MNPYHQVVLSVAASSAVLATLVLVLRHDAAWNMEFDDPIQRAILIGIVLWTSIFLALWSFLVAPVVGSW